MKSRALIDQLMAAVGENPSAASLELPSLTLKVNEMDLCAIDVIEYILERWPVMTVKDAREVLFNASWWITFLASFPDNEK